MAKRKLKNPYEELPDTILKSYLKDCRSIIEDATKSIELIQQACKHRKIPKENQNYMWAPGHISQTRVCGICGKGLGPVGSYTFKFYDFEGKESVVSDLMMRVIQGGGFVNGTTGEPIIRSTKEFEVEKVNFGDDMPYLQVGNSPKRSVLTPDEMVREVRKVCKKEKIRLEVLPYVI